MTPGAWYDLTARLSQARAVAACVSGSLPESGLSPSMMQSVCQVQYLADVLDMLLALAEQDAERLGRQLETA